MTDPDTSPGPLKRLTKGARGTGLFFAVLTVWMLWPLWTDLGNTILGDAHTDAIRGMWGFDYLRHTMFSTRPIHNDWVNFPAGAYTVVLPLASGTLLSPFSALLGPEVTWNLAMALMIWGTAMGVAYLSRLITDRWLPGILAGGVMIAQPMFHHSLADGTVEHVALWSLPLFLGTTIMALKEQSVKWAALAGTLSLVVAIDSPYNAVYALVMGAIVLPFHFRWVRGREKDLLLALLVLAGMAALGAMGVEWLLRPLGLGAVDSNTALLQQTNATDVRLWWKFTSEIGGGRDPTLPPTMIPTPILVGGIILSLVGRKKGLPWLVAGLIMIGLSFGLADKTPGLLGRWLGDPAQRLGDVIMSLNTWVYDLPVFSEIRFPRRWLVPAAMALAVGASTGLAALFRRTPQHQKLWAWVVMVATLATVWHGLQTSQFRSDFPAHTLPDVPFTDWISDQEEDGAVLLLPHVRTQAPNSTRDFLPVFANLSPVLASADDLFLQTRHGRAMVSYPDLQTLQPEEQKDDVRILLRDWSDLSKPRTAGRPIPPSALNPGADLDRRRGLKILREAGLRWIAVDLGAYDETGIAALERQLEIYISHDQTFDQADGIRVFTIRGVDAPKPD